MNSDKNASGYHCSDTEIKSHLCASDEICLSAFVDGEGGWLNRFFAKRILSRNFEARKFVDELERTSEKFEHCYNREVDSDCSDVSLWPRISARIAQEERLTLLRSIPLEAERSAFGRDSLSWLVRLSWSGFGAVAASLLLLVYLPQSRQTAEMRSYVAGGSPMAISAPAMEINDKFVANQRDGFDDQASNFKSVSLDQRQTANSPEDVGSWKLMHDAPRFLDSEKLQDPGLLLSGQRRTVAPQVFEVDWMRSNGRVKVLQDASGKAGIIWVNRPTRKIIASNNNLNLRGSRGSPITQSGNLYATSVGNR